MTRTHLEETLTKDLSTDVMGFIHNDRPDTIKVTEGILFERQGLEHRDDKVTIDFLFILLNNTDGCSWTKLFDTFTPLVGQKLLMDNDHRSVSECTRYGQGYRRLPIATW